jgi:hypothetical protein
MKTKRTLFSNKKVHLLIAFLFPLLAFTQPGLPDYDFRNPVLMSGTDKQPGAKYRFSNVRPGVDAIMDVVSLVNGAKINTLDGPGGYIEAFQPIIDILPYKNGYVEFLITFVAGGTINPQLQPFIPVTPIDIDGTITGGLSLFETDQVKMGINQLSDFDMGGGEIQVTMNGAWVRGKNVARVEYPGIDTTAKRVMFSVFNSNISSVSLRIGADNQTASSFSRLRSVYFKRFIYNNSSLLSVSPLLSFSGVKKNKNIELKWSINPSTFKSVVLEKATNSNQFIEIPETNNIESSTQQFIDYSVTGSNILYRLRMTSYSGKVSYSNILAFKGDDGLNSKFRIFPSAIQSDITMQFKSDFENNAVLQIVDVSGRIMYEQKVDLQPGVNNIRINGFGNINRGHYIAVLRANDVVYSQKVSKQ